MSARRRVAPSLIYAALSTSIVSSLGMLLVPSIAAAMDVSVATAQWMLTANLLAGAVSTPVLGRLADGPHTKRVLVVALGIILVGSVIAAAATSFPVFLVGRVLQGLSYGIVPLTIALTRRCLPQGQAPHVISSLSVTVATGLGVGYPLTGLLAGLLDHRVAFWFAAAFVASAIVVVVRGVPDGAGSTVAAGRFDVPGTVLLSGALATLLLGISEGPVWGWASPLTAAVLALSVVLWVVWVVVELRTPRPLVNLRVLRDPDVLIANGAAIGLGATLFMGLAVVSLVAQAPTSTGYGLAVPVLWAGFVLLPMSVGSFAANRIMRLIAPRVPLPTLLVVGTVLMLLAAVLLMLVHDRLWGLVTGILLLGFGVGTGYAAMPALIARSVADAELGSSVSFNQVLRTVGSSFGTAITAAVIAMNPLPDGHPSSLGVGIVFAIAAALCLALLVALVIDRRSGHTA